MVMLVGAAALPEGARAEWQQGAAVSDLVGWDWAAAADNLAALAHPVRLRLVQAIAERWGCEERDGGKRVWFDLARPV